MPILVDTLYIWPLFAAAFLFDIFAGEYPGIMHPVVWMGTGIRRGIDIVDAYSHRALRFLGGTVIVICGLALVGAASGLIAAWFAAAAPFSVTWILTGLITVFLIKSSFSLTGLLKAAGTVNDALKAENLKDARRRTATHLVSRDTSDLNENEIAAAVIESVAENLTDSIIAPWFFLFVGGVGAALAYRFANTCDSMMGYRNEKYEWLGKFAARFDDLLNFIPARIAALLISLSAAMQPDCSGKNAFKTMLREHRVTESPNAGWTMSAAAGALGLRLVKASHYSISGGESLPDRVDIERIIRVIKGAAASALVILAVLIILAAGVLF
ncbi:MAG: cobalamin biosynthesis protein [Spirochaetales bacterium]|uniref:Cobalamin biosynthesis protein CobD n=1 Tax=Candidatus Thalassospirochaeta sargassi TaxID=3119039 RepID=A0AAJ1MKI9_9SPIO|nr:cobalamin biosynthesis protein [Spirochaetales bacterium]